MASRERRRDRALEAVDRAAAQVGTQIRIARRGAGLSLRAAATAVGMDYSSFGRLERHELENVSLRQLALAAAAVGLDVSLRTYLAGDPVRDTGHMKLLARFRARLPAGSPWATEVPLPIPGDLRALNGRTRLDGAWIGVEAETRLGDIQAVERKALLKKRDARLDRMILLIAETRANRSALELHREALRGSFPLGSRAVLAALARGTCPSADGLLVL